MAYELWYLSRTDGRWHQIFCQNYSEVVALVQEHEGDSEKIEIRLDGGHEA